jgi:hypothetical protein
MHCFVTARQTRSHGNDTRTIARQPRITTTEELLVVVFYVGSAPRLYSEDPRPAECSSGECSEVKQLIGDCGQLLVEGQQLS